MKQFITLCTLAMLINVAVLHARQTQPDAKRIREIQAALVSHDYAPGKNWVETQEILRMIARAHHWQTHRAPDARVLGCVLELGSKNFDSEICADGRNQLDGGVKE
jgi:hypothetical protein